VPASLDWTFTLLTYLTLLWEIAFPFLLWNRTTRAAALLTGIGMHLGIWATMEVGPFSWVMLASYVAFLDPHKMPVVLRRWVGANAPYVSRGRDVPAPGSQAQHVGASD
jgi:hypothetical protein